MGVDLNIFLPSTARHDHVATVLGLALGRKLVRTDIGPRGADRHHATATDAEGVEIVTTCVAGMIEFRIPMPHSPLQCGMIMPRYHFESKGGERYLVMSSSPIRVAAARKVVQFFGGRLVANDCDGKVTLKCPRRPGLDADDGKPWQRLHDAMAKVTPVTEKDIAWGRKFAGYKDDGYKAPIREATAATP